MNRSAIPSVYVVYVVVRDGDRFLFVEEHNRLFNLPAGRAEPGEALADAARREALEESGVAVTLIGLLRVAHGPRTDFTRVRVFFLAEPAGDPSPRTTWNGDTYGGVWLTLAEARARPQRAPEALAACEAVAAGAPVYPLGVLTLEDAPWG